MLYQDSKKYNNLMQVVRKMDKLAKKQCFIKWSQKSYQMVMACRMELLKREYVQNIYQTTIQGNLRFAVR
jgi:hypothetical protein